MSETSKFRDAYFWYRIFKYSIYVLLTYDGWLFLQEDIAASAQTISGYITWRNCLEAYSAGIVTLSWVIFLLVLELYAPVFSDEDLYGSF